MPLWSHSRKADDCELGLHYYWSEFTRSQSFSDYQSIKAKLIKRRGEMADIFHNFPIKGSTHQVFEAISTAEGLDSWWTNNSVVKPAKEGEYKLGFGPGYEWRAKVSQWVPDSEFELTVTDADNDWQGTRVGFRLTENDGMTSVLFHHLDWPESNEHYRTSSFCWAMYLRLLKRYVEFGEVVPYAIRLDV
jgi:uncharacterized protein YndB with AHSA1/START domain